MKIPNYIICTFEILIFRVIYKPYFIHPTKVMRFLGKFKKRTKLDIRNMRISQLNYKYLTDYLQYFYFLFNFLFNFLKKLCNL